jgi:hypothetical protein
MKKLWNALKWLGAVVTALAAIFYIHRSGKHRIKQEELAYKAQIAEKGRAAEIKKAKAMKEKAKAARLRAEAAHKEGEARINELEDSNKSLAEHVRRYNERLERRMRNRRSS